MRIIDKNLCSGCAACALICPKKCISMKTDKDGFLYPKIDNNKCVKCDRCKNSCPVLNKRDKEANTVMAYAVINRDEYVRQNSSSGGVFTQLAKYVLKNKGAVFGAAFDENFVVKHICVEDEVDLERIRKSKYVQSQIGENYRHAKNLLENGKLVLFTGTPCQIGGLYAYLNKPYTNLITQDIICHGVPSPKVWKNYLDKKSLKGKIKNVSFKDKSSGWNSSSLTFEYENEKDSQRINKNLYMRLFLQNVSLRLSCYNCAYKNKFRDSDITLADFWGVEKVKTNFNDDKGTSLLILNTPKSIEIFNSIKDAFLYEEVDFNEAISHNILMTTSAPFNKKRKKFFNKLGKKDIDKLAEDIFRPTFLSRIKTRIKYLLNKGEKR